MSVPGLRVSLRDSVLRLTLDRAEKRNAINDVMLATLISHVEAAGSDEAVRAICITGAGSNFCSGADLAAPPKTAARIGSFQRSLPSAGNRLIGLLCETQTPVVAVVQGWATGLGLHLALAADFCVASTTARLWEPFMARGFSPDTGATVLLPRLVGLVRARQLLMLGREISGTEAQEWGLIHAAVAPEELTATAEELLVHLAGGPTVALGLTKRLLGTEVHRQLHEEAVALDLTTQSEDFREGIAAFLERREPRFTGR